MYAKLVLRNAKRSVKDYLVYIVTMTICVMLFYSFLSISSNYYQPDIGSEYNFTVLGDGMKVAICAIYPPASIPTPIPTSHEVR